MDLRSLQQHALCYIVSLVWRYSALYVSTFHLAFHLEYLT